jgi:large repetitive protein
VNPVNDAPVANNDVNSTNEDTAVSNTVASNDSDLDNTASELTYTQIGSTSNTEGSFTLNTDGTYTFTPTTNFNGSTVVTYKVCDPSGLCDTAILTITVNPVNDAPVANNDVNSTNEDTAVSNTVATNDSDLDNTASELTYTQIGSTPNTEGSFTLNNDGSYTFTPALNFNGSTVVTYKVCDPSGLCDTAILTITVNPVNDAPVANNDVNSTNEDTAVSNTVASNDSDLDNTASELTYTQIGSTPNTEGSFTLNNDGSYTFTPALNFNGSTVVTYKVCDPSGLCDTATLTITVNPINDAPIAQNDVNSTNEDTAVSNTVASNDSDLDNTASELTYTQIGSTPNTEGSFTLNPDGSYTFTPALNFNGSTVVTYKVCDPSGLCDTATLTITVNPVNDAPVAQNDTKVTNENTAVTGSAIATDIDGNLDNNSFATTDLPLHGTIKMNPNGSYTYTPNLNFNGVDSVHYKVCDLGMPIYCATATLIFNVNPVNSKPIVTPTSLTTTEDSTATICTIINDPDLGDSFKATSCGVNHGTATGIIVGNQICVAYTPFANYSGSDTLCFVVCDANGACDTLRIPVVVTPVNDAPIATATTTTILEDNSINNGDLKPFVSDPDNPTSTLVFSQVGTPITEGVFTLNPDGTYTFVPNPNFNGTVVVTYQVCDPSGLCSSATLTITVTPVNDAPIATATTTTILEDNSITNGDLKPFVSDIDNPTSTLVFSQVGTPITEGVFTLNPNGTYTFVPNPNFNGTVVVTYQVCDPSGLCSSATLTITVTPVNNAPIATATTTTILEDNSITNGDLKPFVSDIDNPTSTLVFSQVGTPITEGVFTLNPDGTYTFVPNPNFNGTVVVTYQVCDPSGLCSSATLTITVTPVNNAPIADNDSKVTNEDTPVSGTATASDVDNNLNTNSFEITDKPANGKITMNPDGSYTYTPDPNFNGVDSVHYKVCDLGTPIYCATATLIFTIKPVNNAPVVVVTPITVALDSTIKQCFPITDKDANDKHTATICNTPKGDAQVSIENGQVCLNYKAPKSGIMEDSVCITICDSSNACVNVIVPITITGCADTAKPDIICPVNVEVNIVGNIISDRDKFITTSAIADNCQGVNLSFTKPTAVDFCGNVNVTQTGGLFSGSAFPVGSHIVTFEAKNTLGKTATCQTEIVVKPIELLSISNLTLCQNDSLILKANSFAGGKYQWTNPNKLVSNGSEYLASRVENAAIGQYILEVTFGNCTLRDTINVDVYKSATTTNDSYIVASDDILSKNVTVNDSLIKGGNNVINLKSNVQNGTLVFNKDGSFQYTPKVGFVGIESFDYEVCSDFCPTACTPATAKIDIIKGNRGTNIITPNGDGDNDGLEIEGYDPNLPGSELSEIKVFNQWGDMVYKTTWYKNDWSGNYKNLPLPAGTYYYIFQKNPTANAIKGFVTILR